jgi:hypothetical protein
MRSFFFAGQNDNRAVPPEMANLTLNAPGGKIQVPGADGLIHSLTISGYGANIAFRRNREVFYKLE